MQLEKKNLRIALCSVDINIHYTDYKLVFTCQCQNLNIRYRIVKRLMRIFKDNKNK